MKRSLSVVVTILLLGVSVYFISSCAGIKVSKFTKQTGIYIETDIKPTTKFEEARIKSLAILKFDAKNVKSMGGEIIDYIDLSNKFTDDLLKKFYNQSKIDVALGEYEDKVIESDTLEKKRGDLEVRGSTLQRSIQFNCTPYKKIESVLRGRINKFQEGDNWDKSFIDITLKLTDTYTGSIYWITDMRGYVKDVIDTIVKTVSSGKYKEPIPVKQSKVEKKKDETKVEKKETEKTEKK